jgi:hypothetical protein
VRTESLATLDGATRARVLQRQYALLVSMAPMEPLCEHVYTAGLPVMHFGPTFSLLTSPWLQLALYTALGSGACRKGCDRIHTSSSHPGAGSPP